MATNPKIPRDSFICPIGSIESPELSVIELIEALHRTDDKRVVQDEGNISQTANERFKVVVIDKLNAFENSLVRVSRLINLPSAADKTK